jgi:hypothetical protein
MCPVCLATGAMIAGSATGTGGLTALVATTFRKKKLDNKSPTPISLPITEKEDRDGHQHD